VNESDDKTMADSQDAGPSSPPPEQTGELLTDVQSNVAPPAQDLEGQALAAAREAEAAIAEGQRAIQQAHEALRQPEQVASPEPRYSRTRELVLRSLLAVNLAAMIIVVSMPAPSRSGDEPATGPGTESSPPAQDPAPMQPRIDDPVIRAFAAADRHDYRTAIRLLDEHLIATPRMAAGRKANVLLALEHYATQVADFGAAQEYQRRAEALRRSHSLPEDLVQMALEAEKNGDVESMRRHYARLLLQQRQIPSSLYRHVAEAYLKLGDSYRQEAEQSAAEARRRELEQMREQLRRQAINGGGK